MTFSKELLSEALDWSLDFSPRTLWPSFLPVLTCNINGTKTAVTGFDRKSSPAVSVLVLESSIDEVIGGIYRDSLAPLEKMRLNHLLKKQGTVEYLWSLPMDLQNFLDDKAVPIKTLKPLEHLTDWVGEITRAFLSLNPSSSQIRDLLDLLCDLKFLGQSWLECAPTSIDVHKWLSALKKIRHPLVTDSDENAKRLVAKTPWPRGVQAKWERTGDQGGVVIQAKINSGRDWKVLKEKLPTLEIEDGVWNN